MNRFVTVIAAAALAVEVASAFAPIGTTPSHAATPIYLVPEQGRQLVAFSQDYLTKKAKESASKASNLTSPRRRHTESCYCKANGVLTRPRRLDLISEGKLLGVMLIRAVSK